MILTFEHSKFILKTSRGDLVLQNLKEAAKYRKHASYIAEKVLSRHLLTSVPFNSSRPIPCPSHLKLMPFQKDKGIPFILSQNKTYLAHQPGLGKSAQSICAVSASPGKTLIVCPSFLKINWAREITKWYIDDFPEVAIVGHANSNMNWDAQFIIVSDAMISKHWVLHKLVGIKFKFVFIDEGHRFKNPEANRTIALFGGKNKSVQSRGLVYAPQHVCVLSGTPMLNRPIELWPVLAALAPETIDFMSYQNFGFKYGGAWQDDFGRWHFTGSTNESELHARIFDRFMQRITKVEVLKDLPDKIREVLYVDEDTRSMEVKKMDKRLLDTIDLEIAGEELNSLGDYARVRHETGLAKIKYVVELIQNILNSDPSESIILFCHHRDVVSELYKQLVYFEPQRIYGYTPQPIRTAIQDLFQSGKCRLIIGNIDAMNLGLTLTRATRIIFAEYAATPAANEQAEDRAHRIGQTKGLLVQYVVMPNSIDEVFLNILMTKEERLRKVIG